MSQLEQDIKQNLNELISGVDPEKEEAMKQSTMDMMLLLDSIWYSME